MNIYNLSLAQLNNSIQKDDLFNIWNVNKNLIDVCKNCEYRYMCVDNRIPIQRNEKEWFHEMECNYNPYITKWQNEKDYKTLAECGVQSNAEGFKINRKKLNRINNELWGL